MIEIDIPGYGNVQLEHIVLDYNGTLAIDGILIPGTRERLTALSEKMQVHIITADTFGRVESEVSGIPCTVSIMPKENQDTGKLKYIHQYDPEKTVCVGNGRNDRLMLKDAAIGIALVQEEGASAATMQAADVVCEDILSALDLLTNPLRLVATLRS
ncbi:MAG: HAD hydrolase family protein [bacterium]|nr:HAD hydrolase family protein [bacterium]